MADDGFTLRRATSRDWEPVAALLAELGRPAVLGGDLWDQHREAFSHYLERPNVVALVAEREAMILGFVDMEYRTRLNFLRPQAWIPDMIVTEAARGQGIGAALLARCEELARDRGCFSLSLESASGRAGAHEFYKHEGWNDSGKSFTKNLTGEQWPPAARP
jgi:GNAT superfamily N-acetyltransferase